MRISEDVKRAVVFLGHGEGAEFKPIGTAFFVQYAEHGYIVTVRHVAAQLGDDPFMMRMNKTDGSSGILHCDPLEPGDELKWYAPDDQTIDLAVLPCQKDFEAHGFNNMVLGQELLIWGTERYEPAGIGDSCYAVGLFARFSGKTRNIPIVHTGNLASMGDGERIPIRDGNSQDPNAVIECEGFLVEMSNLPGLSGAPVFVRPTISINVSALLSEEAPLLAVQTANMQLLGVWTGSWEGAGANDMRVPVGMGVVTPVAKLIDLLESEPVATARKKFLEEIRAGAIAQPDVTAS